MGQRASGAEPSGGGTPAGNDSARGPSAVRPRRVLVVYGTRPEVIKMAPVVRALTAEPALQPVVCTTAQHRQMADQIQQTFGLQPDLDLDVMVAGQSLDELAARVLVAMRKVLASTQPDALLVQGDTTTAMAAALSGFHAGVDVGHVEAGLRTDDIRQPFPEEANRRIIDTVSTWMFAPTAHARDALLAEGHAPERVLLTGNTVVDALHLVAGTSGPSARRDEVLVTVHRRENHGEPLRQILAAVGALAERYPSFRFTLPVHPNPAVRGPVTAALGDLPGVRLVEPLGYPDLVDALRRSRLVLTDSGGIQEEAPSFGTPVLVLRDVTERPEGVDAGVARLVGTDSDTIVREVGTLLDDPAAWADMSRAGSPYGDGRAAERIAGALAGHAVAPWDPIPSVGVERVS